MNIFFLSWDPDRCAELYCDQHVNKILLEIVQMLYTAWHLLTIDDSWQAKAPKKKDGTRAYKPISNPKHPMAMWVRSHRNNYTWTAKLGMSLAIEFHNRFEKLHGCTKHIMWLYSNVPETFTELKSPTAYYSSEGFPSDFTPVPECMEPRFHHPHLITANLNNYRVTKLPFARWRHEDKKETLVIDK